jgi:hypothetical protein
MYVLKEDETCTYEIHDAIASGKFTRQNTKCKINRFIANWDCGTSKRKQELNLQVTCKYDRR